MFPLYLDPGTGSLLLYALLGIITTLWFAIKNIFFSFRGLFSKSKISVDKNESFRIVFHSEGGKYFHVFKPVIDELIKQKEKSIYVTPDANDPALKLQGEYFTVLQPGNELATINFMNHINADIVVSTTPHLDIYMWKRSKHVKKYAHLFHAPTGIDFYEKYALSFYDIILCVGPFTEEAQAELDKKRNLPQKQYIPVGCTYYDYMLSEYSEKEKQADIIQMLKNKNSKQGTILYAPTWGKLRSSFFSTGQTIMRKLLEAGYDVIFRPHPQFYVSHKQELESFMKEFSNFTNLTIDNEKTPVKSMILSDLLITDFSGVLFDYAYLSEKPVLLLNVETATAGYEAEDLEPLNIGYDINASKTIAQQLTENEINNIESTVENILNNINDNKARISEYKKQNVYNFGQAGKACADSIVRFLETL